MATLQALSHKIRQDLKGKVSTKNISLIPKKGNLEITVYFFPDGKETLSITPVDKPKKLDIFLKGIITKYGDRKAKSKA